MNSKLIFGAFVLIAVGYWFGTANQKIETPSSEDGKFVNYLFISKKDRKLDKVVHSSKTKEKFTLTFHSENNIFAEKIEIIHQNIKLKIELNYFKPE